MKFVGRLNEQLDGSCALASFTQRVWQFTYYSHSYSFLLQRNQQFLLQGLEVRLSLEILVHLGCLTGLEPLHRFRVTCSLDQMILSKDTNSLDGDKSRRDMAHGSLMSLSRVAFQLCEKEQLRCYLSLLTI